MMGDKIAAKTTMMELGVPLVPGSPGELEDRWKRPARSPNKSDTPC